MLQAKSSLCVVNKLYNYTSSFQKMNYNVLELGSFVETKDGAPLKFKITTVPKELYEEVIEFMATFMIPREPLYNHTKMVNDPIAQNASRLAWRGILETGISLVAIAEKPGPLKDRIVGANMTFIRYKDKHETPTNSSEIMREHYLARKVAENRSKIFERYGVDKYLASFGLTVHPKYCGYHIAERLLQCRKPLCRHLGIKVTAARCTAPATQYLIKKVGFTVLYEEEYSKFKRDDGKVFFEGYDIPGKFLFCALSYE